MADIDTLPPRGIRVAALVDGNGIASNGSQTVAQLAARGMRAECAVDATGVSTSGASMLQIGQRGLRAFCPVNELGIAQDATTTAATLRQRGIRPVVMLDANGIALNGSANIATLAQRGLQSFCPVDETGNATTLGAAILISNTTVLDNVTIGTTVGTLSVAGGSGTYTFTLTSNPGSLFATAGTNGVNLNTAAALTAGDKPITVQAAGGVPTPISRALVVTVLARVPAGGTPTISGSTVVLSTLTAATGTWTGTAPITYSYQWKRGATNVGTDSSTYATVAADIGSTITVTVTATNTAGSASATSAATATITGVAPANAGGANLPVITGTAQDGQTLTVSNNGTWTGTPAPTFSYQWKRGATNVGTNSASYTLVTADVGSNMTCVITGTNVAGNASATSNALGPVIATGGGGSSTATYFIYFF